MSKISGAATISLENIAYFNPFERMRAAAQLADAVAHTPGLEAELPQPAHWYRDRFHGYRRLHSVANNAATKGLLASVIEYDEKVIGMATVQRSVPKPNPIGRDISAAELSYWHRTDFPDFLVSKIGSDVVAGLVKKQYALPREKGMDRRLWIVTEQDDAIKAEALADQKFVMVDRPIVYELGDDVTEPRQLWVRDISVYHAQNRTIRG